MAEEFYFLILIAMISVVAILVWRVNNLDESFKQSQLNLQNMQREIDNLKMNQQTFKDSWKDNVKCHKDDNSDILNRLKVMEQTLKSFKYSETGQLNDSKIIAVEEQVATKMKELDALISDKCKSLDLLRENLENAISRSSDEYTSISQDVNENGNSKDNSESLEEELKEKLLEVEEKILQSIKERHASFLTSVEEKFQTIAVTIEEIKKSESVVKTEVEERYKSLDERLSGISELQQKHVGFSARLGGHVNDMAPWSTLVFNGVLTNIGNAYSGQTGIFTVPMHGVYIFYAHILGSARNLEMCLQKNGENIMFMYSHGPANSYGGDSNMAVLNLVKGDTVKVVKHGPWGTKPYYVHAAWSSFSGFLLYPL